MKNKHAEHKTRDSELMDGFRYCYDCDTIYKEKLSETTTSPSASYSISVSISASPSEPME